MTSYLIKRLLSALPTLFILSSLLFFLLRLAPGGPFDGERAFPAEVKAAIDQRYGLDKPLTEQYQKWITHTLQGDLGESFQYIGQPVVEIIFESLPASITLGLFALFFAFIFGVTLGLVSAWKKGSLIDRLCMFISVSGVSLPGYLIASLLVIVFSLKLNWLPAALWEGPSSAVLPIITLALRPLAMIARITRASVIETLSSDYIRTAYAKGLHESQILLKHALKNGLIPLLTLIGPITANLVTGSFLVENVFQIPGMGKYFVSAILNRDYPVVMGVTLFYGFILIFCNLVSDVLCAWADPRIHYENEELEN